MRILLLKNRVDRVMFSLSVHPSHLISSTCLKVSTGASSFQILIRFLTPVDFEAEKRGKTDLKRLIS